MPARLVEYVLGVEGSRSEKWGCEMTSNAYSVAFKLLILGYSVIPSGGGAKGKAPLVNWKDFQSAPPDDNQLEEWETTLHPTLWGIVTGGVSGCVVVDCDTPAAMQLMDSLQPHVRTPHGGAHYYFKHPGTLIKTAAGILPGVDIRADGGFVNTAGGAYRIITLPASDNLISWDKLPTAIREALTRNINTTHASASGLTSIQDGQRNATLISLAGMMRRKGLQSPTIEQALLVINRLDCKPPLDAAEVHIISNSAGRYSPGDAFRTTKVAYL